MAGFAGFSVFRDAVKVDGKTWTSSFRKVVSNATVSGIWCDLSYSPGNPPANFYATEPLVSATLSATKGIDNGGSVSPSKKFYKNLVVYSPSTAFQSSTLMLCDYVLYYPFIDGDSTGPQELTNSVPLPRYVTGSGVRAILVSQGSYVGGAQVSITYTNQDGVSGRVSPLFTTNTTTFAATLLTGGTALGNAGPFIPLQGSDSGIRSVENITFLSANGGICALVLVKPIAEIGISEVTATFATPTEQSNFLNEFNGNQIEDGAYLNFLCLPNASLSAAVLQGYLTTVWG
jgi:hypothetical protein